MTGRCAANFSSPIAAPSMLSRSAYAGSFLPPESIRETATTGAAPDSEGVEMVS